jgi:hypothetical protein
MSKVKTPTNTGGMRNIISHRRVFTPDFKAFRGQTVAVMSDRVYLVRKDGWRRAHVDGSGKLVMSNASAR